MQALNDISERVFLTLFYGCGILILLVLGLTCFFGILDTLRFRRQFKDKDHDPYMTFLP